MALRIRLRVPVEFSILASSCELPTNTCESGTKVIASVGAIDDSKDLMKEAIAWCCGLAVNNSTRIRGCSFGKGKVHLNHVITKLGAQVIRTADCLLPTATSRDENAHFLATLPPTKIWL